MYTYSFRIALTTALEKGAVAPEDAILPYALLAVAENMQMKNLARRLVAQKPNKMKGWRRR